MSTTAARRSSGEEVARVRLGDYLVPAYFYAKSTHPALPFKVQLEIEVDADTRSARCRVLTCVDLATDEAVTGKRLRQIPLTSLLRAATIAAAEDSRGRPADWTPGGTKAVTQAYSQRDPAARWALDDAHLREVARVYREAVNSPLERAPIVAVAEHFGRPRSTAARWVAAARAAKHLAPTTRGRAGEIRTLKPKRGSR
jgi:hypothetical protein